MKASQIIVGGVYLAKVSDKIVRVRVDSVTVSHSGYGPRARTHQFYDVTNLTTGRRTTFRSAAKFRRADEPQAPTGAEMNEMEDEAEEMLE